MESDVGVMLHGISSYCK